MRYLVGWHGGIMTMFLALAVTDAFDKRYRRGVEDTMAQAVDRGFAVKNVDANSKISYVWGQPKSKSNK